MSVDDAVSELIDEKLTNFKVDLHTDLEGTVGEAVEASLKTLDWSDQADAILGSVDVENYLDMDRILRDHDVVTDSDVADKVSEGIDNIDWDYVISSNDLITEGEIDDKITEAVDNIDWDSVVSDNDLMRSGDLEAAVESAIEEAVSGNIDWDDLASRNDLVSKRGLQAALVEAFKSGAPTTSVESGVLNAVEARIGALESKVNTLTALLVKAHTALQMQAEVAEEVAKLAAEQPAA